MLLDEPTNHSTSRRSLARGIHRAVRRRGALRYPRSRVPGAAGDAHRRARSRAADVVARRLRDLSAAQGRGAGERDRRAGAVRQEARGRGGLAAPGHQGEANEERRARARAPGDARGASRTPRAVGRRADAGRTSGRVRQDGVRAEARIEGISGGRRRFVREPDAGDCRLFHAHHARRSHRPDRPERRRQDDAVAHPARRGRTDAGEVRQRQRADRVRPAAGAARPGGPCSTPSGKQRHGDGGQPPSRQRLSGHFLFQKEPSSSPVKALSGGERNRLLLARLFTRPASVLVLDGRQRLDLETLELLGTARHLAGTLLLVSHDRTFLDNVVTSTVCSR